MRVAPRDALELSDEVVNKFVVEGQMPLLRAEKASDLPLIQELLVTGADMFKMLAVGTTFTLLNSFGSWKVLRVPEMRIEVPGSSGGTMKLPAPVLEELRIWDSKQVKPDSIRIVRIRKYPDVSGYAFVIRVLED